MKILVDINNRQNIITLNPEDKKIIQEAVTACLRLEDRMEFNEISLSFVTNEEIQALNQSYRGKDQVTDVLSFPMEATHDVPEKILGDIVIAVPRMVEQAAAYGHSLRREMVYLVVHSMFHLLGYNHMTEEEKRTMRQKEEKIMALLDLSR